MALAISLLGSGLFDTTNSSPYTHAAVTPAASCGVVVGVLNSVASGGAPDPSLDTPTWAASGPTKIGSSIGATVWNLTMWEYTTVASPGSDDLVATISGSPSGCCIIIVQITGQNTTDFTLQPNTNTVTGSTAISQTLAGALASSESACLGFFAHNVNEAHAPAGSESELADNGHGSPARRFSAQYEINDTTSGITWVTSNNGICAIVEIAAAGAAAEVIPYLVAASR